MKYYYLKYGDNYFARDKTGHYYLTTQRNTALIYKEKEKGKILNIKEHLPRHYDKDKIIVLYYENEDEDEDNGDVSNLSQMKYKIKYVGENCINFEDVKTKISNLSEDFKQILDNKSSLIEQLSVVDSKISDLLHYIEFYKFSASEGYKMCKQLQEFRDERRKIKQQLEAVNIISTQTCSGLATGRTLKAFDNLENKKYAPRILTGLFEGKENRRRKIV